MIEDSRLGGAGRASVVVASDRVEQLRRSIELLEETQPEVDVAEEAAFLGRREDRWPAELARPPDVVDEGGGEQQVAAEAGVDLGQLAAEGRYADGVLE